MTRDLLISFRQTVNCWGQVGRIGIKYENTTERTFNSAPGWVRDLENFKEGDLLRSHGKNMEDIIGVNSLSKDGESHENKNARCFEGIMSQRRFQMERRIREHTANGLE